MALRPQPAPEVIDLTSPSADLHIISPEPEALPIPPWFLDDLSEDLPRNPPNSPAHSSTETRHPTTTGSPQYLNIWFMSSEPSSTIPPSVPSVGGNHTSTKITPPALLVRRSNAAEGSTSRSDSGASTPGPVTVGTQKTLAAHSLLKSPALRASPPPPPPVAAPSPARATSRPYSLLATCTQPRDLC
jgi:hypothetical protein